MTHPASKRAHLAAVAQPSLGGVAIRRHVLEVETERVMHLVKRVGFRLRHWLRTMPETRAAMRYDRETFTHYPILDATGNQLTEPLLPDRDFLENAEWYTKTMLGLLKEQRERAKMVGGKGGVAIDDATFEAELAELTKQAVREMPTEQLRALLAERSIDIGDAKTSGNSLGDSSSAPGAGSGPEQAGTFLDEDA